MLKVPVFNYKMSNWITWFITLTCISFTQVLAEEKGYLLLSPRVLAQNGTNELQLYRYGLNGPGNITIKLMRTQNESVWAEQFFDLEPGEPKTVLKFRVPQVEDYEAKIQISGQFAVEGEEVYKIFGEDKVTFQTPAFKHVFIQTDKPLYKPGQKVQIRVLIVDPSLKPLGRNKQIDMWIEEPKSNSRVAQWKNISVGAGLIQREFMLSDEPNLGSWRIITSIDGAQDFTYFQVKEYVLPKFEVTITPPSYVLITAETIPVKICGRYTYGKPVEGTVGITASLETYSWSQEKFPKISYEGQIDGCYSYNINVSRIDEEFAHTYRRINIVAEINETATGISQNTSISIDRTQTPLNIRHETKSGYFRPGLPLYGKVKMLKPDNKKATNISTEVCATIARERVLSDWWATRKTKYCRNYTSNEDGTIPYIIPPQNTDVVSINIEAKSNENYTSPKRSMPSMYPPHASFYIRPWYSPSGSHLQIQNIEHPLPCGQKASIQVLFTANEEGTYKFYYQVINSGKVRQSGFVTKDFTEADNIATDSWENSITTGAKEIQIVPPQPKREIEDENEDSPKESNDDNNCKAIRDARYIPMLSSVNITIDVNAGESPAFHFLVYRIREDREVVADSHKFNVEKCFDNKVELKFGDKVKQPGTKTSMQLKASPNSLCGIKVVDKSIKLMDSNEQITVQKIFEVLQRADNNHYYPRSHCYEKKIQPGLERKLAASTIIPPRPWAPSSSYEDAITAIELSGYLAISDLILLTRPCRNNQYENYGGYGGVAMPSIGVRGAAFAAPHKRGPSIQAQKTTVMAEESFSADAEGMSHATKSAVDVRTHFPETWLFNLKNVGEDGEIIEKLTLPHTITEWLGNAVCINDEDGLGLTAEDAKIKGFQAFFLSFTLPYSIIRGEKLSVIVTVFNYLDKCLPITLTFEQADGFKLLSETSEVNLCVCGGKSISEKFIIEPTVLDILNLTASAKNSENADICNGQDVADVVARDALTNQLLVEAEGFKYEKTENVLFCPSDSENGTFNKELSFKLPEDVVEGSARGYLFASGDIMGSAIQNLDHLIRLPIGCGEQNMITFSPIVSVLQYLDATKQLQEPLKVKAIGFLNSGYQRELKYRHSDGSYSTFGETDKTGSTFLTAFVVRSFAAAGDYIEIDKNIMTSAINWLVAKQKSDGSFEEMGATLSHGIKGGLNSSSTSLTAYVVSSLMIAGLDNVTVIDAALTYITSEEEEVTNPYQAALFAYTFALAGQKTLALQHVTRALNRAETTDGEIKWKTDGSTTNSVSLETAAYALLALLKLDVPREKSLAIVRGITKSRNSIGGYYSTQDTILVLEALSKFAAGLNDKVNLKLTVSGDINEQVDFTEDDKLQVRQFKVSEIPTTLEVEGTGTGCGLIQATVLCNTVNPPKQEVFDLQVEGKKSSNCKSADIKICTRYLPPAMKSNMALVEIKMISGMAPDEGSLEEVRRNKDLNMKGHEIKNNNLIFYFEELTNNETCFSFQVNEISEIQDTKPAIAQVYDYYAIDKQQKVIYDLDSGSC